MAYIQTANRTIERSPHVAAIGADYRDFFILFFIFFYIKFCVQAVQQDTQ